MADHSGHRQRLKERFAKEGLDNFDDLYVLELLLFYCVPRKDTNDMAHALLDHFGTAAAVLDAPAEEVERVPGIGKGVSTFFSLVRQVNRHCELQKHKDEKILNTVDACGKYMIGKFSGKRNETVVILCLDAKCKVLCCKEVTEGSVNSAGVSIRRVVEIALASNATSVVLGHNHPSGLAFPSGDDIVTTDRIAHALEAVDVILVDHLVFSDKDWVSMVQSGYYKPRRS